jgi:hypothetical protein
MGRRATRPLFGWARKEPGRTLTPGTMPPPPGKKKPRGTRVKSVYIQMRVYNRQTDQMMHVKGSTIVVQGWTPSQIYRLITSALEKAHKRAERQMEDDEKERARERQKAENYQHWLAQHSGSEGPEVAGGSELADAGGRDEPGDDPAGGEDPDASPRT